MEVQEKHRLEILNAKYNYVCAVDILQKKMSYGEDVSCCINKLYLASRLINRLECYCFETPTVGTEIKSQFSYVILKSSDFLNGDIFQLIFDGKMIWSKLITDTTPAYVIGNDFLNELNIPNEVVDNGTSYTYTITLDCNVTDVKSCLTRGGVTTISQANNIVMGTCTTSNPPCYNCITTSDLPKMYEILHKLLS